MSAEIPPLDSNYSTVVCAPIFTELSLEKSRLTDYLGEFSETKKEQLDKALQIALALSTTRP